MTRSKRKWDHIRLTLAGDNERSSVFKDIKFIHNSLPDSSVSEVRLNHSIGGLSLSSPIFINAMTGGGGEKTYEINRGLAEAAKQTGLAMAVGSQMAAIKDKSERKTYEVVRLANPNGIIFANLGSEASTDQALAAVEMLNADALQIHLNVLQELTMPEGDRDFAGALKRIEKIAKTVNVPVIVKETGFGMTGETVKKLTSAGAAIVDIGGFGGTNFARIENNRREEALPFFNDWGIPTAVSIAEALGHGIPVIGSGGIRSSNDIAKAIAMGAEAVGLAAPILKVLVQEGEDALIKVIRRYLYELSLIMAALGTHTISELQKAPLIVSGDTFHWLDQRGIDTRKYSMR